MPDQIRTFVLFVSFVVKILAEKQEMTRSQCKYHANAHVDRFP